MRSARLVILPAQPATKDILRSAGFTRAMIETQLRAGRLVRLRAGVVLAASALPVEPAGRHLVLAHAEQTKYPEGVLSHESAAIVWNLPTPGVRPWHEALAATTFPAGTTQRSRHGVANHHIGKLPPHHLARDASGYVVTSVARTAVDLAGRHPLPEQLVLLDAAARRICESLVANPRRRDYANPKLIAEARRVVLEAATVTRSGRLRLGISLCTPERESAAESVSAGHFHLAGFPTPLFNPPIHTAKGTLYPDCYWPAHRLVGECDGASKYTDQSIMVAEKQREQWFRDERYPMVRWLGYDDVVVHLWGRAEPLCSVFQVFGHTVGSLVGAWMLFVIGNRLLLERWYGVDEVAAVRRFTVSRGGRLVFWACVAAGIAVGFVWGRDIPTMVGRIERPLFSGMVGAMCAALLPVCRPQPR